MTASPTRNELLDSPLLTVNETCTALGISRGTLYAVYIPHGYLEPIKLGQRTVFAGDAVTQLIDSIKSGRIRVVSRSAPVPAGA